MQNLLAVSTTIRVEGPMDSFEGEYIIDLASFDILVQAEATASSEDQPPLSSSDGSEATTDILDQAEVIDASEETNDPDDEKVLSLSELDDELLGEEITFWLDNCQYCTRIGNPLS